MALFSIPAKYMATQQTGPFIEKQLEDIYLKVSVVRKITSVKVSLDNGQIYYSNVKEMEGPPVLIPVGEKETVSESQQQGGDNSDHSDSDSIRRTTNFNIHKALVDVIHLTEEVGIQFSSQAVQNITTNPSKTEVEDADKRTTLTVAADIIPLADMQPNQVRTGPESNLSYSDRNSFEASSFKEVSACNTISYHEAVERKSLDIKKSPAYGLDNEDNTSPDVSKLISTMQDDNSQLPHPTLQSSDVIQRAESVSNDELLFDETSSQESVDLAEVELDIDEEMNFSEVSPSLSINKQPGTNSETALIHKPFSVHQKQKTFITKKIRGSECLFCYDRFPLKRLHQKHMEEGTELSCELCPDLFKSQCLLKQHCHKHFKQDSKVFTCLLCQSQFPTKIRFLKHNCLGRAVSCKVCCESFTGQSVLNKHMEASHGTHKCAVCKKFFSSEESLQRHRVGCLKPTQVMKLECGDFKCLTCAGLFKTISLYIKHRKVSNLEKGLNKCAICGRLCSSPCSLNLHSNIQNCGTKSKPVSIICNICKEEFQNRRLYLSHMQDLPGMGYVCRTSLRVTRSKAKLQKSSKHLESKTSFPCDKCGLVLPSRYWLKKHCLLKGCQLNMKKNVMSCFKYGRSSAYKGTLKKKASEKFTGFTCETCGKQCSSEMILSGHIRTHEGQMQDGRYHCAVCDRTYERRSSYLKHHAKVHCDRTKFVKCPSCKNAYSNEQSLKKHILTKHEGVGNMNQGIEPYYCRTCEKFYTTKTSIFRHKVSKTCMRFTCTICKKHCTNEQLLSDHLLVHQEQTPDGKYHCDICDKTYSYRTGYLKHKRKAQCDLTNFSKCSSCNNIFANEKALNLHKKIVHKEGESYYCDICQRHFTSPKAFSRHKAIDKCCKPRSPKPTRYFRKSAQCDTCGKIFSSQNNLTRHIRRHTGEKPFVCTECGKRFADKCILKNHIHSIHEGTRAFLCQVCGKSFKTFTHLERHTQSHKEKNLQCSFCTRKYKYAKTLQDHQNRMHASLLANVDLHQMGLVEQVE